MMHFADRVKRHIHTPKHTHTKHTENTHTYTHIHKHRYTHIHTQILQNCIRSSKKDTNKY